MVKLIDEQCNTGLLLRHSVLQPVVCLFVGVKDKTEDISSWTPRCSYYHENSIRTALLKDLAEWLKKRATGGSG
jgi:hypothetical protein